MSSQIEIVNLALARIGAEPISDLLEASKAGRLCRQFFQPAMDEILQYYPWKCCRARTSLAALADTPAFGWSYQYQLPADCLRVVQMENPESQYDLDEDRLLTNEEEAKILYVKRVSAARLRPWVVKAIYTLIASQIAQPLSASASLAQSLRDELERRVLPEAKSLDAQEGYEVIEASADWLEVR